jgi:hypothetical protein
MAGGIDPGFSNKVMGATKHEKSFVDFEQPYEQNLIGLKGIIYFGVGLFLLIVITFALMWVLLRKMDDQFKEEKTSTNPLAMNDKERLPPEPRLQTAPGFGIQSGHGWVNLELKGPQGEYREYRRQWDEIWERGEKDAATGTMISMPIEEAKKKFIGQNAKSKSGEEAEKAFERSRMFMSDASAGRVASEKRR